MYIIDLRLNYTLHGHRFANDEVVKGMVHVWLHAQLNTFFTDGIRKLMDQCNKSVEKLDDYNLKKKDSIFVCAYHL